MREGELVVTGYKQFLRACDHAGKDTKREVRGTFRRVGEIVRANAAERFSAISPKSAEGYRVSVRQRGVSVEQGLRRTTGRRPDYGALQMRDALLPALESKEQDVEREFEHAIDTVVDIFNRI